MRDTAMGLLAYGAGACSAACALLDGVQAPIFGIVGVLLLFVWLALAATGGDIQ